MASLTKLRKEITFNSQLGTLLNVMKSIATQQYQSLEDRWASNPSFFEAIQTIAGTFDLEGISHPFCRETGPVGVIAVTSDAGLLGGLNQQVIAAAVRQYRTEPGELIVVGKRGLAYLQEYGYPATELPGVQDEKRREQADQLRDYVLNKVLQGELSRLVIVYPRSLTFTSQRVETVQALPCQGWLKGAEGRRGVRGGAILMESTLGRVLEYLVWAWLSQQLFDAFGSARLAELGARSAHLEGSSTELKRRKEKLMRKYFRERHEVIDRGMRELFAAKAIFGSEES